MNTLFIIITNRYTSQIEIDGKRYGNATFRLTYNGVIKFRVNHDLLVITVREGINKVRRVYIPVHVLDLATYIK